MSENELEAKIFRLQARIDQLEAAKTPMPSAERRRIRRELWKNYRAITDPADRGLAVEILGHLASMWETCPMHSALAAARSRFDDEEEEAGVGSMFR